MSNMVIATNVLALNSHRSLKGVGGELSKSSEKLSSGYRINRAADDAAGLAISEKMRSQIRGLDQASRNSQDGISLIQTAEGALQETENMLQRMRELAVQASNGTLTQSDRDKIALELDELSDEIDSTAEKTEFNTLKLIDGSWKNSKMYLQTGANEKQGLEFNIEKMDSTVLGVTKGAIGDVVRGNSGLLQDETVLFSALGSGVGSYNFGDGRTLTINDDKTLTVTGYWEADTTKAILKEGTYSLDSLTGMTFTLDTLTTPTKVTIVAGTSIAFQVGKGVAITAPTSIGEKIVFDNGSIIEMTDDNSISGIEKYKFKNTDGLKLVDANGKSVSVDPDKEYTATELANMKIVSADGQMFSFDSAGLLETDNVYTNTIKFRPSVDTNGSYKSQGKDISSLTKTLDAAIEKVSTQRAKLGAYQNRLEHTIKNLDTSSENLSASESRIRDTDMAKEMMKMTKANVLQQAATSMLAQANQAPQNILKLLG